jgi:hypothetical protein
MTAVGEVSLFFFQIFQTCFKVFVRAYSKEFLILHTLKYKGAQCSEAPPWLVPNGVPRLSENHIFRVFFIPIPKYVVIKIAITDI